MRALLQRATKKIESDQPAPDLLPAVQRKIRKRSRGKFFADGWSTTNMRINYALIAIVFVGWGNLFDRTSGTIVAIALLVLSAAGLMRVYRNWQRY